MYVGEKNTPEPPTSVGEKTTKCRHRSCTKDDSGSF
jgi:hypothetical protein